MWDYQEQLETGQGCWRRNVCTGTTTFRMFEERNIQWFCSDEQLAENLETEPPKHWNLEPLPEKVYPEFKPSCETDADCPRPDFGQVCTRFYWDATIDGKNFSNGIACYNWEHPVCPGNEFAAINFNYENTGFSYYYQAKCVTEAESTAQALLTTAATVLAMLNMF